MRRHHWAGERTNENTSRNELTLGGVCGLTVRVASGAQCLHRSERAEIQSARTGARAIAQWTRNPEKASAFSYLRGSVRAALAGNSARLERDKEDGVGGALTDREIAWEIISYINERPYAD